MTGRISSRRNTADMARSEWLELRRRGVGASDVAGILGMSPWQSPWSVWAHKVGLIPDDDDGASPSMRLGLGLEPVIAEWFERDTGLAVVGRQTMVHHHERGWHFATVDGFVAESPESDPDDALAVFESKYTPDAPWSAVPDHYRLQAVWQMYVTGLPECRFAVMHMPFGRPDFRMYSVTADPAEIEPVVELVTEFWFDHVTTGNPPAADATDATTDAITVAYSDRATLKIPHVDATPVGHSVRELARLKRSIREISEHVTLHENTIRAELGWAGDEPDSDRALSDGWLDGELAVSWRSQTRTSIDADAVRADHGHKYDRQKRIRVLRLHGRYAT